MSLYNIIMWANLILGFGNLSTLFYNSNITSIVIGAINVGAFFLMFIFK